MRLIALTLMGCLSGPAESVPQAEALAPEAGAHKAVPPVNAPAPIPSEDLRGTAPEGFTDLAQAIPTLQFEIAYHTAENFTGAPLPGYGVPCAWLYSPAASALARVQDGLVRQGLGLRVFDAYRPRRGTLAMVAWAERTNQHHLLNGYIARVSQHNRGIAVDLTLVDLARGEPLDMGTAFDVLDARAHTRNAQGAVLENRLKLVQAMAAEGWENYSKEWWHYTYKTAEKLPPRDVPCSCFEPPEGRWSPPEGWNLPGYEPPLAWTPQSCHADI